jgi:hemoglobin-like flavoprotein
VRLRWPDPKAAAAIQGDEAMTPDNIKLVQESFRKVVPIAGTAADLFYDRLFEIAPELRHMFPQDLREQKKKLIGMLATAVNNLHHFDQIRPAVEELGRRHLGYGVADEHYKPVGEALLWTLEQGLGKDFTPAVKEAWTQAYLAVADTMKLAARRKLAA